MEHQFPPAVKMRVMKRIGAVQHAEQSLLSAKAQLEMEVREYIEDVNLQGNWTIRNSGVLFQPDPPPPPGPSMEDFQAAIKRGPIMKTTTQYRSTVSPEPESDPS
jgi:hypothetical protein